MKFQKLIFATNNDVIELKITKSHECKAGSGKNVSHKCIRENIIKLKYLLAIIILAFTISCSNESSVESVASIEGTWNAVSCANDEGIKNYGTGDYANVQIKFTLNTSGSYIWITDNTKNPNSVPVVINGTYIYTESNKKLKVTGKSVAGPYSFEDNHLFTVESLSNTKLVISEDTDIIGIGKQTFTFKR